MNKYKKDVLFVALIALGRSEREAGAILDKVYEKQGVFKVTTDSETARQLAFQFNEHNPAYLIRIQKEESGRATIDIASRCETVSAPWVQCVICGESVKTCEREKPDEHNSYLCPVHPDGCQLHNGRWVCSYECWEKAAGEAGPEAENL